MEVHDVRGAELGYIQQIENRFSAREYRQSVVTHVHRETTEDDIALCTDKAHEDNADMVLIQEYGIAWYIPNIARRA